MGRTGQQDEAWHNALVTRWRAPLIQWLAFWVGPDRGACEDIAQEVLLEAWCKRDRLADSPDGGRKWLYRKALGLAANRRRGRLRFDANLLLLFPLQHHPDDRYGTVEMREDFRQAFLRLTPKEQKTFYLNNCGFAAAEIAEILGDFAPAVRQRTKRARHKLSRHMQDYNSPAPPHGLTTTGGMS